jgi:hypothetical protein
MFVPAHLLWSATAEYKAAPRIDPISSAATWLITVF